MAFRLGWLGMWFLVWVADVGCWGDKVNLSLLGLRGLVMYKAARSAILGWRVI